MFLTRSESSSTSLLFAVKTVETVHLHWLSEPALLENAISSKISREGSFEPVHEISNNVVCATSKAYDQPAHTRSLIRPFASRSSIL